MSSSTYTNTHTCPNPSHLKMVAEGKRSSHLNGMNPAFGRYECPLDGTGRDVNCAGTGTVQGYDFVMPTPCEDCIALGYAAPVYREEPKHHWRFEFTRTLGGEKICFRAVFYDTKQSATHKAHMLKEQLPRHWEGPIEDGRYVV